VCGIGAILDPEGTLPERAAPDMAGALRHRGPDGEAIRRMAPATLVHTRLAIIDVEGGDQPLYSEDGTCAVVVNGEIYNHRELRSELERAGHRFATHSDSEVVVHLYEQEGLDCLRRLNGMFAFALWDARAARLVVARDPFGVKPLYWCGDGDRVLAASEIGALLATGRVARAVDRVALEHFLAWRFVPAPRTMLAGVHKLAAGEVLVADRGGVRVSSYRQAPGEPWTAGPEELEEELGRQLEAAVQRQLMSDVPLGAFLSGGVDSAAIVAAMRRGAERDPLSFAIGFPGHGDAVDERQDAAETARLLGSEHRDDAMVQDAFPDELRRCVAALEEPCGIPSAPALLQLSRFARRHVHVVLSGQGADEPLAGYERHQAMAALGLVRHAPSALRAPVQAAVGRLPRQERLKRAAGLLGAGDDHDALLRIFEITPPGLRAELSAGPAAQAAAERRALADGVLADVAGRDLLARGLYLDTHLFLPDGLLIYGDKMSMASALEQRVPFLDVELMRFVERIPAQLRLRRLQRKWLYKRSLRGRVPAAVLTRRKRPFATPYDAWLRTSLGAEVERRYAPSSDLAGLLDGAVVGRLVAEHRSGRADHKRILYCLLELAHWHEAFVAGARDAALPAPSA
jgi:asparagine synthase (glutamine-hydrolysing)